MTFDAAFTLGIVVLMFVSLALDKVPPVASVLAAVVILLIAGVIDERQAFSGFANPAPLSVAALYVLARAADKTGLLSPLVNRLLGKRDSAGAGTLARICIPSAAMSSFINSTPVVAMLIPEITSWSDKRKLSPSRFLLPLSYASILGGAVTVLGTSTNLVVSGLLVDAGMEPFGLFEISIIGGAAAAVGLLLLCTVIPRLIPERKGTEQALGAGLREFLVELEVAPDGKLDGTTIGESGLTDLDGVYLLRLQRGERRFAVASAAQLRGGDVLTFAGQVDDIVDLQRTSGLRRPEDDTLTAINDPELSFFEAVIGTTSPLVGRTLDGVNFTRRYGANVVAIHRAGTRLRRKLDDTTLQAGDTLLVLAEPGFRGRWRESRHFLLIAQLDGHPPVATRNSRIVGATAFGLVALAGFGVLSILQAALVAAAVLIVTRVLTFAEARNAIDLDVVALVAGAFGVGAAMQTTGLAQDVADVMLGGLESFGTFGVIFGMVITTSLLTELVTNNAAAVVVFPIAVSVAAATGIDVRTMAIALAVTASSSFLTPLGYQTNTMVYGPGGYRITDYLRAGIPLNLAVVTTIAAVATLLA